jgi:hypothetical protein
MHSHTQRNGFDMNNPTPEELKAAIEGLETTIDEIECDLLYETHNREIWEDALVRHRTALFALRFTERMMGEPSLPMLNQLTRSWDSVGGRTMADNFKAMRNELIKEMNDV